MAAAPPLLFLTSLLLFLLPASNGDGFGIGVGFGGGGGGGYGGGFGGYIGFEPAPPAPAVTPPAPPAEPQRCDFINEKQYQAYLVIQEFKRTITCDPLGKTKNWVGPRPCNYNGFACDTPPNTADPTVAAVDFNGFQFSSASFDRLLARLPDLAIFHANSNNFTGAVPDISHLPYFYELDLSNNKLSGSFPTAVVSNPNLRFLDIRYNAFAGCVPPSVFSLKVDVLFLNNNQFNQPLPSNLGSTPAKYLTLANNGFTGPIPRSIGNAAGTLVEVLFLNNKLSGCLPYEIGLLNKATVFDAGYNQISGQIPYSFGCLAKVEQLNLAGNQLFGEVPDGVCALANLRNLSLSSNYLTSLGKSCWNLLEKGTLDIRNNCIPGCQGQRSPEECKAFACKPKSCTVTPYQKLIPCKPPCYGGADGLASDKHAAETGGGRALAPSPAYSALANGNP